MCHDCISCGRLLTEIVTKYLFSGLGNLSMKFANSQYSTRNYDTHKTTKNIQQRYNPSIETLIYKANKEIGEAESKIDAIKRQGKMFNYHEQKTDILEKDIDMSIKQLERTQQQIADVIQKYKELKSNISFNVHRNKDMLENSQFLSDMRYARESYKERHQNMDSYQCFRSENNDWKMKVSCKKSLLPRRHSLDDLLSTKEEDKERILRQRRNSLSQHHASNNSDLSEGYCSESDTSYSPLKSGMFRLFGSFGKGKRRSYQVSKPQFEGSKKEIIPSEKTAEILSISEFTKLVESLPANDFCSTGFQQRMSDEDPRTEELMNLSMNFDNSFISCTSEQSLENMERHNNELDDMGHRDKKILYVAKEIMTSEKVYVEVLKLLNIDFRHFIQEERQKSKSMVIPTEDFLKLFSNLPELFMLNSDLLKDFESRVHNWSKLRKISDIIVSKGPYLKLYTAYVKNFANMSSHFDECCKKYQKFGKLAEEFEKFPQCRNLKLSHYMLKPVQRLPQYKLLLEDYLKNLDASSEDYDDTTTALRIVTDAADHANETIKQMVRTQS